MAHPYRKNPINHCGPNHKEEQDTPLNHCGSSMMHSEGWNKMRTHNSPNTIGNEAAFNKNKKLRNPLNKGRCWENYEPTPGKKAYEDGSCQPIKRRSALNVTEEAYEKQNKKMRSDHKKETGSTLGDRQTSGTGSRRVSFACRFAGMDGSMTEDNGEPSKLAMALKKWGFSSKGAAGSFCNKNKKS